MSDPNAQTQRMYPNIDLPCTLHEHRLQQLEARMTAVEKTHEILGKLTVNVELLNDRVRLLLWVGGLIAGAFILGVVGSLLALLMK